MIAHRLMDARDGKFVLDSWAKSYRESDYAGLIQNCDWFAIMLPQLAKLIAMPSVHTMVAYDPSDADRIADIYGWISYEHFHGREIPLVYYVFVKSAYRRKGIARALFKAASIDVTMPFDYACWTYVVDELDQKNKLPRHAVFEPMRGRH